MMARLAHSAGPVAAVAWGLLLAYTVGVDVWHGLDSLGRIVAMLVP